MRPELNPTLEVSPHVRLRWTHAQEGLDTIITGLLLDYSRPMKLVLERIPESMLQAALCLVRSKTSWYWLEDGITTLIDGATIYVQRASRTASGRVYTGDDARAYQASLDGHFPPGAGGHEAFQIAHSTYRVVVDHRYSKCEGICHCGRDEKAVPHIS